MPQTQAAGQPSKPKIVYVDNIKVALTVLVILHHAFITYGAPGRWYYAEKTAKAAAVIPHDLVCSRTNPSLWVVSFLLSALFVPASYYKKGVLRFLSDRLLRFGVPLVFYAFILSPIMNFMVYRYAGKHPITFMQFLTGYDGWIQFGVLWFVWALLLFNIVYVLVIRLAGDKPPVFKTPSIPMMLLFAECFGS